MSIPMNKFNHPMKCPEPMSDDGGCFAVCDFCLHFLFYRNRDGQNIDGSGWCGLHRKETEAGGDCKDYYCKNQWKKNISKEVGGTP